MKFHVSNFVIFAILIYALRWFANDVVQIDPNTTGMFLLIFSFFFPLPLISITPLNKEDDDNEKNDKM